jgi:predicted DNA-binding transcriptional regulator AlpA
MTETIPAFTVVPAEPYLSQEEVADMIGVTRITLWQWCRDGIFPQPMGIGKGRKTLRWERAEVMAFMKSSKRNPPKVA